MRKLIFLACAFGFLAFPALGQNNARMLGVPNAQTGTSYTFVTVDTTRITTFNNASSVAVTLPSGANQGFGSGTMLSVVNLGAGTVTITCISCTINGNPTLQLASGSGADIYGGYGVPSVNYVASLGGNSANAALKCATSDACQFVSSAGNDSNDGRSAGSAKLTLASEISFSGIVNVAGNFTVISTLTFTGSVLFQCNNGATINEPKGGQIILSGANSGFIGCTFTGPGAATSGTSQTVVYSGNGPFYFQRNSVSGFGNAGGSGELEVTAGSGIWIQQNDFSNDGDNDIFVDAVTASSTISDIHINDNTAGEIEVHTTGASSNINQVDISGNHLFNGQNSKTEFCVEVGQFGGNAPNDVTVAHNSCVTQSSGTDGGYSLAVVNRGAEEANTYNANSTTLTIAPFEEVQCTDCSITGNTEHGSSNYGFKFDTTSNSTMTGNVCDGFLSTSKSCIFVGTSIASGNASNNTITANTVFFPSGGVANGIWQQCNASGATCNNNLYAGNVVISDGTAGSVGLRLENDAGTTTGIQIGVNNFEAPASPVIVGSGVTLATVTMSNVASLVSASANPAQIGILRLAHADFIGQRNLAGSGDDTFGICSGSDLFCVNGSPISASPAGSPQDVQLNVSGAFGTDSGFLTEVPATHTFYVGKQSVAGNPYTAITPTGISNFLTSGAVAPPSLQGSMQSSACAGTNALGLNTGSDFLLHWCINGLDLGPMPIGRNIGGGTGSPNTYTSDALPTTGASGPPVLATYNVIHGLPAVANTGAATLTFTNPSLGPFTITKCNGTTLAANDMVTSVPAWIEYTSSAFVLLNPQTGCASTGGVTSFSGDGTVLNNSGSTGAVTATLANFSTDTVLGNPTGSSAAPIATNTPVLSGVKIGSSGPSITATSIIAQGVATSLIFQGGLNTTSNNVYGSGTFTGGQITGGTNPGTAGNGTLEGGTDASTSASSSAGNAIVEAGQASAGGKQGFAQVIESYTVSAALTNAHEAVCGTSTKDQVAACTAAEQNIIGEAESVGGTGTAIFVGTHGSFTLIFDGTPVIGDVVCFPPTAGTTGEFHDNGTSACGSSPFAGVVRGNVSGSGAGATATVAIR